MPAPVSGSLPVFPTLKKADVDACRLSHWYDTFEDLTVPSSVIDIRKLGEGEAFIHWLDSDSIFLPVGSEAAPSSAPQTPAPTQSTPAAGGAKEGEEDEETAPEYHLPALNNAINEVLRKYPQVFPKLNLTAPRDAAFVLQTSSGPLVCQRASDVYLFLKSSNLIHHDLEPERLYEGCEDASNPYTATDEEKAKEKDAVPLELVLRKYITDLNPALEFRCFVRDGVLVGITQRDLNFYDHLQDEKTQEKLRRGIREFFEDELASNPPIASGSSSHPSTTSPPDNASYVFDIYVDTKGALGYGYQFEGDRFVLMDFQPYRSSTDSMLFSYEDIRDILQKSREGGEGAESLPVLRVIDSAGHPDAIRNQPTFSTNMMPVEMIELSEGRNLDEFREVWAQAVAAGMVDPADLPVGGPSGTSQN